jgi:hypothetical protein
VTSSSVRLTSQLFSLLSLLLILVGCGGGSGNTSSSTTAQNAKSVYGYFRKTNGTPAQTSRNTTVNMSYGRIGHTATLLADGRVLIAGGNNSPVDNPNFTTYNSAELFDPSTELFSLVPSTMSVARTEHCAVMLPDKRVLMISGGGNYGPRPDLSLVDLFDPTTNTFSSQHVTGYQLIPTGTTGDDKPHCFLLPGERVFIFGGAISANQMAAPSVLDLTTWTVRPVTLIGNDPLLFERYYESATQASDGRVFVVGGMTAHYLDTPYSQASADTLVFDPLTETMQVMGQLLTARTDAGILPMDDGSVEVYGGATWASHGTVQRLTSIERISLTGSATKIGDLADVKLYFTSVLLQNNLSLHVGGADSDGLSTNAELVFDEAGHWSSFTGNMVKVRLDYGIDMLGTGRVLITGGEDTSVQANDTGEIYEPGAKFYVTTPAPVLALSESVQLTQQPNLTATWSTKVGTVSASGLYTAPDLTRWHAQGNPPFDDVTATASDGSRATARIQLLAP